MYSQQSLNNFHAREKTQGGWRCISLVRAREDTGVALFPVPLNNGLRRDRLEAVNEHVGAEGINKGPALWLFNKCETVSETGSKYPEPVYIDLVTEDDHDRPGHGVSGRFRSINHFSSTAPVSVRL